MAGRDGVPTLMKLAKLLCTALGKFSGIIAAKYPDNPTLQAALTAASTACAVLQIELAQVRDYGD